jgi:hypothetical protein
LLRRLAPRNDEKYAQKQNEQAIRVSPNRLLVEDSDRYWLSASGAAFGSERSCFLRE